MLVAGASANEGREVGPIVLEVQEVKASKKVYVPSCGTFGFGLEVRRTRICVHRIGMSSENIPPLESRLIYMHIRNIRAMATNATGRRDAFQGATTVVDLYAISTGY